MRYDLVVIGAGAGGCFAAIRVAELFPHVKICVLEAARKPLSKVEISGGGRCNVTHACFDPEELIQFYPRGARELLGPFYHFQPADMVRWLEGKGVSVKAESDGRMFPASNSSSTIVDCFLGAIKRAGIELRASTRAARWSQNTESQWEVELINGEMITSKFLLIASGSDARTWQLLENMGHHIVPAVPSLFTFNIRDKQLNSLLGISLPNTIVRIPKYKLESSGPLLITHWGLSGPAVLKLSAWGARELHHCNYVFDAEVNWLAEEDPEALRKWIRAHKESKGKKQVSSTPAGDISSRLWKYLCTRAGLAEHQRFGDLNRKQTDQLTDVLLSDTYRVTGKSTFKEEFVTAGGVDLKDIDMRSFESKKRIGLYLVGEVLNIDALTGGFNFQAAWTGAEIAALAISEKLLSWPNS